MGSGLDARPVGVRRCGLGRRDPRRGPAPGADRHPRRGPAARRRPLQDPVAGPTLPPGSGPARIAGRARSGPACAGRPGHRRAHRAAGARHLPHRVRAGRAGDGAAAAQRTHRGRLAAGDRMAGRWSGAGGLDAGRCGGSRHCGHAVCFCGAHGYRQRADHDRCGRRGRSARRGRARHRGADRASHPGGSHHGSADRYRARSCWSHVGRGPAGDPRRPHGCGGFRGRVTAASRGPGGRIARRVRAGRDHAGPGARPPVRRHVLAPADQPSMPATAARTRARSARPASARKT